MKISLPKSDSDTPRSGQRDTLAVVWYVVIGIFVGASGTYLFEHGFHLSAAGFLAITAILAGAAISAALKYGKLDRARRARTRNNTGQIRAWLDYRPRHASQRHGESQGAEPVDALSVTDPATHIDDTVWFDFVPVESAATDEPANSLPQSPTTKVP